jgi:hypothetical protein
MSCRQQVFKMEIQSLQFGWNQKQQQREHLPSGVLNVMELNSGHTDTEMMVVTALESKISSGMCSRSKQRKGRLLRSWQIYQS